MAQGKISYDDNGNPILGYDDNGNPIAAGKAPDAPAEQAPKAKAPTAGFFDKIGEMMTAGLQTASPFAPIMRAINADESRPMTEQEQGVKRDGTAREYASQISAARAQAGEAPTTAEMMFPASEAARRADIAAGRIPQGGYAEEHPRAFIGDVVSFPSRAGGAIVRGMVGATQGNGASKLADWMTDPTGVTGSPSGILLFANPAEIAGNLLGRTGVATGSQAAKVMASPVLQKAVSIAKEYPKATRIAGSALGGLQQAASGVSMDNFGGGGGGGYGIPSLLGTIGGAGGRVLSDMAVSALPGFKQIIAEEMKRANPKQAVTKGQEVEKIMRDQLEKIGFAQAVRGVNAIDDIANKNLDQSGDYYDFIANSLSPRVTKFLEQRPKTMSYDDLIEAGYTKSQARRWDGKVPFSNELRGEHLIWTSPEKTMIDIADPNAIGPTLPVLWDDFLKQGRQKVDDASYYGAHGAGAANQKQMRKMFKDKASTINSIENMYEPGSRMYLDDLSRIRRQANIKHGSSIKYGAAQLQNLLGSVGLGEFPTRFMYGENRKLQDLGLAPVAREAGKLYKEGKIMQQLASGDVKQSLRRGNAITAIADQSEGLKYRVPLFFHALGKAIEKSAPRSSATAGNR